MLPSLYRTLPRASVPATPPTTTSSNECLACKGQHRAHTCSKALVARKPAIAPPNSLQVGQRVRVYWTGERQHYEGVIVNLGKERGRVIHEVQYDDGHNLWHDMANESWQLLDETPAATQGSVHLVTAALASERARTSAQRERTRDALRALRDQQIMAFVWVSELGDDLSQLQ